MTKPGKAVPHERSSGSDDLVLRAKYLDYCSARVADVLLRLSPDEMFLLAEEAARESGRRGDTPPSYDEIVRLATERISRTLTLPEYESWIREYRADPERFEREMLGLWESGLNPLRGRGSAQPDGPPGSAESDA